MRPYVQVTSDLKVTPFFENSNDIHVYVDTPIHEALAKMATDGIRLMFELENDFGKQQLNIHSNNKAANIRDIRGSMIIDVGLIYKKFDKDDPTTIDDFFHVLQKHLTRLSKRTRKIKQRKVVNSFISALREI